VSTTVNLSLQTSDALATHLGGSTYKRFGAADPPKWPAVQLLSSPLIPCNHLTWQRINPLQKGYTEQFTPGRMKVLGGAPLRLVAYENILNRIPMFL
jgi:hypothetical protein